MPWMRWERIALPKALGGWGLKNVFLFSKALDAKVPWRLIATNSLCIEVVWQKYITPRSILDWLRNLDRWSIGVSVIWKVVLKSMDLIGQGLAWRVGNGR